MKSEERFLTPVAVNKMYGVPLARLRGWIRQGKVDGFQSGNRFYVDVPAFMARIEAGEFKEERG